MKLEVTDAIENVQQAIHQLEAFIPKDNSTLGQVFSKAWYYIAFGIYGLELYYKQEK